MCKKQALGHVTRRNTEDEGGKQETVFSPDLTYKIGMKVNNKHHGIISQKVAAGGEEEDEEGAGSQLVGWLITPHSTLKWEVCMCKYIYLSMYIYIYIYIYLVERCVQKIKEGTDKLKLMIEVIIPESYRCGGGAVVEEENGGSATKRDTLSFKLEGRWVGSVERVGSGRGGVLGAGGGFTGARVGPRI